MEHENAATAGKPWRYRPRSNIVFAAATALLVVVVIVAGVQAGDALQFLPWALALAAAGWAVFVRPAVVIDDDGVTLVNPFRSVQVPWAALINVTTRFAATLQTPGGNYAAWAAPGPGRHAVRSATNSDVRAVAGASAGPGQAIGLGDLPTAPSGLVAFQIRRRWRDLAESGALAAGEADATPVRITIAWPLVIVLVASLAAGVAVAVA